MAGRHRRPPAWQRLLRSALGGRAGVGPARAAALHAEVIALRATVIALRRDLDLAIARSAELTVLLAARAAAPVVVEMPLLRLALSRVAEPPLTREMAIALAAPDHGEDTARVEIVLSDLPEHSMLDPLVGRDSDLRDLVDLASAPPAAPERVRRSA